MDTQALILPARNIPTAKSIFRLLDLPQESQDNVYDIHFQGCTLKLADNATSDKLILHLEGDTDDQNDLDEEHMAMSQSVTNSANFFLGIELVCRRVNLDARRARSRVWPRNVYLKPSLYQNTLSQVCSRRYTWLQNHIDRFKVDGENLFKQGSVLFPLLLNSFPHLRHLGFDRLPESPLVEYILTSEPSEELQQVAKDGVLICLHRICFRRHKET